MSSRINGIYDALDHGNPKLALKLCQSALQKQSASNIVKALMALAYSRLEQSESAIEVCMSVLKETPPRFALDESVVETLNYVFRRERRFDLSAMLLNKVLEISTNPSTSTCTECFIANVQAGGSFENLPKLALRLYKMTNEKKYMEWYAFALSLQATLSPAEDSTRLNTMALSAIEKLLPSLPPPSEKAEDRWKTSGRRSLYLGLFRVQLLAKLGQFEGAISAVNAIDSTLITDTDREQLVSDLNAFGATKLDGDKLKTHTLTPLEQMNLLIESDALISRNPSDIWNDESLYSAFISCLKEYIQTAHARSDILVIISSFIPLVRDNDRISLLETVSSILCDTKIFEKKIVNLYKLVYSFGGELNVLELVSSAQSLVDSEDCLDECSPAKQLLLLAAIALLEKGKIYDALSILSYGSSRFSHCSHFRLIECIVYGRSLGLSKRSIERFEALGIKNAQWRSLLWLIEPILNSQYIGLEKRDVISYSIHQFFDRHEFETKFNYKLLIDQGMYWMFDSHASGIRRDTISKSREWMETEKIWSEIIEDFEISDSRICGSISDRLAPLDYDYSPLLFIAFPKIGSGSTVKFFDQLKVTQLMKPRCCGFRWPSELVDQQQQHRRQTIETVCPSLSTCTYLGRQLVQREEESMNFLQNRQSLSHALNQVISGNELPPRDDEKLDSWTSQIMAVMVWVISVRAGNSVEDDVFEKILRVLDELLILIREENAVGIRDVALMSGRILNGWIQGILMLSEHVSSKFLKKSVERKSIRKFTTSVSEKLSLVNRAIEDRKKRLNVVSMLSDDPEWCSTFTPLAEHRTGEFVKKITSDIKEELDTIKTGYKQIIDRINLGKV